MASKKEVKPVEIKTGEDSFSGPLKQAQEFMTGHPAQKTSETEEELLDRRMAEKAEKDKEKESAESKETTEEKGEESSDQDEGEKRLSAKKDAKEEKEEESGEEKPSRKPKFHTVEEADEALQKAERRMHSATEEAADLRRDVSTLQKQLNDLLLAQIEEKNEKKKVAQELKSKEMEDVQTKAIEEMLESVRSLDPEDANYNKKYSQAMVEYNLKIKDYLRTSLKEEIVSSIPAPKDEKEQKLRQAATRMAKSEGLDMNPEEGFDDDGNAVPSVDYELFWEVVYSSPGKTLKEQVQNAVKKVNRVKKTYQAPLLKAREKKETGSEAVLEHGSREMPEKGEKPAKPLSLSDAIHQTQRII